MQNLTNYQKLLMLPALGIHINDHNYVPVLCDKDSNIYDENRNIYSYESPTGPFLRIFYPISINGRISYPEFNSLPSLEFAQLKIIYDLGDLIKSNNFSGLRIAPVDHQGLRLDCVFEVYRANGEFSPKAKSLQLNTKVKVASIFTPGLKVEILKKPFPEVK
jgi:hypothetical protein